MSERAAMITGFLSHTGFADAKRIPIAGDASARRYERLISADATHILMDVPLHADEDTRLFLALTRWLANSGLATAKIIAQDEANGFAILEDFGTGLFAKICAEQPGMEATLYDAAVDALVTLHKANRGTCPELPDYDMNFAMFEAGLIADWYLPVVNADQSDIKPTLHTLLGPHLTPRTEPIVVLRDYHAENLFWLPDRRGVKRVGLIDYQGARIGSPAYDIASLRTDARRDVSPNIAERIARRYCAATDQNHDAFGAEVAAWGVQRNLKIIGIFARLLLRDNKAQYVELLPRVWDYLQRDLEHPSLAELATWVTATIPPPNEDAIDRLRAAHNAR